MGTQMMEPTLESALERLRDIQHKDLEAGKKLQSVNRDIDAMEQKLRVLKLEAHRISRGKEDVLRKTLPPAIREYCADWSLPFFKRMRARLPREIRDVIYAQIWDEKTLDDTISVMTSITRFGCGQPSWCCEKTMLTCEPAPKEVCPGHGALPFFTRPAFVGTQSALEMIESWYGFSPWLGRSIVQGLPLRLVESMLRKDAFFVGLDPTTVLRELSISVISDYLSTEPECEEESPNSPTDQQCIDTLLLIEKKKNFKLSIQFRQKYIRLNQWLRFFDMLRSVVNVYEREGAQVRTTFVYDNKRIHPQIEYDVLHALKHPDSNWRQDAEHFFENAARLRDKHRAYRIETEDDYNSDTYSTTDSEEYADSENWDYDDIRRESDDEENEQSCSPRSPQRYYGTEFHGRQIDGLYGGD